MKILAQPILYHYPDVKIYTPFFKTVIARPDLAASVRVCARLYEFDWNPTWPGPQPYEREDITYLIQLGQRFNLTDDGSGPEDAYEDLGAEDDVNFKRCFEYLIDENDSDDGGIMGNMAYAAYRSLLTALHFSILPSLTFAMVDVCDGRAWNRHMLLTSSQLLFEFPYLKKAIVGSPKNFSHLRTVVFRSAFHYRPDSLGLESIAYALNTMINVRVVLFDLLRGAKPNDEYQDLDPFPAPPELSWAVLPQLEEVYFDPCVRREDPPPMLAMSNMLKRCSQLQKLVYRHKYPD